MSLRFLSGEAQSHEEFSVRWTTAGDSRTEGLSEIPARCRPELNPELNIEVLPVAFFPGRPGASPGLSG